MAKSNRDRVGDILDALREALGPYVLQQYTVTYGAKKFMDEVERTLSGGPYPLSRDDLRDVKSLLAALDVQKMFNLMAWRWDDVFKARLGKVERSYVNELQEQRNRWAHQTTFSNDEAYRMADTATRLLEAVGAPKQAELTREIGQELLRLRFDAEEKKSKKPSTPPLSEAPSSTTPGLKAWRMVVEPHPDVASGRYIQAEFAADLAQVVQGKADPEYGDPHEFFRRTYLTEGLLGLLANGVLRLSAQGGDPVVQLQTSFGGGKTHSMLALYHLFSGNIGFSEIPGGEHIVQRVGAIDDRIVARRAVIVGTAFSAVEPRQYPDATTHTLWGDIAYQLGGLDAYRMVEKADLAGVNPGSDTLVQVLEQFGPALIIIDELVAFARNLYGVADKLTAGSFDSVMSFVQSLTEAVKRSSDALLLVSIPESDIEIGGEGGKVSLEILAKTIGRIESIWKPVTATESFEIVRRRLFSPLDANAYAARDAVLRAFREMYAQNSSDFPSGSAEGDYYERMKSAYPIHPELFERLYQDWSTLDRFQRTRGVLRLMAAVIHRLWQDNDQSLMIMPGSIPLWHANVHNEMLRYLPENWPAIVDADIDGSDSRPFQIDQGIPTLGRYAAARRIARSIFVGSAPSVAGQAVRGVEEVRIRLATIQPGEQGAVFGDALRRMSQQLTYLYTDGSRYWYDTRPTVNRIAQDRAQTVSADDVYMEAERRLRSVKPRRDDFAGAHVCPQSSADVPDEWEARVVVLGPDALHRRNNPPSDAQKYAQNILETRGSAPRLYRNMLVFIAPDANDAEAWERAIREYLAWKSIDDQKDQLNLDTQQINQVKANLKRTDETVLVRMQETYSWLIVPAQPDPMGPIEYQAHRISGQDSFYDRAARKLRQSELLITHWSPDNLRIELDRYLWVDRPHLGIKQLWDYLSQYCYLPRLYSSDVLLEAVVDGVTRADGPFGYATSVDKDENYTGLVFQNAKGQIYFNDRSVLVHPDIARSLLEEKQTVVLPPQPPISGKGDLVPPVVPPQPKPKTRYHGSVSIDPMRPTKEFDTIVSEIIQHLTSMTGTEVEIIIEINAQKSSGFDETTLRTINENSRTLKFGDYGFE